MKIYHFFILSAVLLTLNCKKKHRNSGGGLTDLPSNAQGAFTQPYYVYNHLQDNTEELKKAVIELKDLAFEGFVEVAHYPDQKYSKQLGGIVSEGKAKVIADVSVLKEKTDIDYYLKIKQESKETGFLRFTAPMLALFHERKEFYTNVERKLDKDEYLSFRKVEVLLDKIQVPAKSMLLHYRVQGKNQMIERSIDLEVAEQKAVFALDMEGFKESGFTLFITLQEQGISKYYFLEPLVYKGEFCADQPTSYWLKKLVDSFPKSEFLWVGYRYDGMTYSSQSNPRADFKNATHILQVDVVAPTHITPPDFPVNEKFWHYVRCLPKLQQLRMGSKFGDVPEEIDTLQALTKLEIYNKTGDIENLKSLKNINYLSIGGANWRTIPAWLNEFKELTYLQIYNCGIDVFPDNLNFPKLGFFVIEGNRFQTIPNSFFDGLRKSMVWAHLKNNKISSLPDIVLQRGAIYFSALSLKGNPILNENSENYKNLLKRFEYCFQGNCGYGYDWCYNSGNVSPFICEFHDEKF